MSQDPFARLKEIVDEEKKEMQPDPVNNYLEKENWIEREGEGPNFVYTSTKQGKKLITIIEED